MESRIEKYFSKHPIYNAVIHAIGGIGIGALLTNSFFNPHPIRYGILFLAIAVGGHILAFRLHKKGKK